MHAALSEPTHDWVPVARRFRTVFAASLPPTLTVTLGDIETVMPGDPGQVDAMVASTVGMGHDVGFTNTFSFSLAMTAREMINRGGKTGYGHRRV